MATLLPNIEAYIQKKNAYNHEHYPVGKLITAEEWNALWWSTMYQGNYQDDKLKYIIADVLPEHVNTINTLLEQQDLDSAARHTHSNKAILDGTQESFTTPLKNKLVNLEAWAQVNRIENIKVNGVLSPISSKTVSLSIPTKLSDVVDTTNTTPVAKAATAVKDAGGNTIHTTYSKVSDIVNDLVTNDSSKPLSATQGKNLKTLIDNIVQGTGGEAVDNVQALVDLLSVATVDKYPVSFNFLIKTLGRPDVWVSDVSVDYEAYAFTTDKDFTDALALGDVQIGHYTLSPLETLKVDLTNYVSKNDIINNLSGTDTDKPLSANQGRLLDEAKVDRVEGKVLSDNNYSNDDKAKVDNIIIDGDGTKFKSDDGTYKEMTAGSSGYQVNIYLSNEDSEVVGYKKLSNVFDETVTTFEKTAQSSSSPKEIAKFLFDSQVGTSLITSGDWVAHMYCKVDNAANETKFLFKPFAYHLDGTVTYLFDTPDNTAEVLVKNTTYQWIPAIFTANDISVLPTDRIGVEVWMTTTRISATKLEFQTGNGYASHVNLPLAMRHDDLRDKNGNPNFLHLTQAEKDSLATKADIQSAIDEIADMLEVL